MLQFFNVKIILLSKKIDLFPWLGLSVLYHQRRAGRHHSKSEGARGGNITYS
jgi:hypothetical protein